MEQSDPHPNFLDLCVQIIGYDEPLNKDNIIEHIRLILMFVDKYASLQDDEKKAFDIITYLIAENFSLVKNQANKAMDDLIIATVLAIDANYEKMPIRLQELHSTMLEYTHSEGFIKKYRIDNLLINNEDQVDSNESSIEHFIKYTVDTYLEGGKQIEDKKRISYAITLALSLQLTDQQFIEMFWHECVAERESQKKMSVPKDKADEEFLSYVIENLARYISLEAEFNSLIDTELDMTLHSNLAECKNSLEAIYNRP